MTAQNVSRVFVMIVVAVLYIFSPNRTSAQTIIAVNQTLDQNDFDPVDGVCDCDMAAPGNQCSLRAAFETANILGGWIIIAIPNGFYSLSLFGLENQSRFGDLDVYSGTLTRLDITGSGINNTFIDALGLFNAGAPERVLDIRSTVGAALQVNVSDLTISNGRAFALNETKGGGMRISGGTVSLDGVRVSSCQSNDDGGGIWVETSNTLTLLNSFIESNIAPAVSTGGGIRLDNNARLMMTGGGINSNQGGIRGGGIRVPAGCSADLNAIDLNGNAADNGAGVSNDGTVTATGGFHQLNIAGGSGGCYENRFGANLTLRNIQIDTNQAQFGGALNNSGTATIDQCWITGNTALTGGGIQNNFGNPVVNLFNSTVAHNTANDPAVGGGGIRNSGRFIAVNSTISNNRASNFGGGIYFNGNTQAMDLSAVTIAHNQAGNSGAGVFIDGNLGNSPLNIITSLVADNTLLGGGNVNFLGSYVMTSFGFNLDTDGSCAFAAPGDQSVVPANIGPLQNNGGPTPTHELLPGSLAIDHGACFDLAGNPILTDQRGVPRTGACDVGAFEAPGPPNDDCANRMTITAGGWVWDNCGATTDGPMEPCGFTGIDDKDVWYEFVMPCNGTWDLHVGPAMFDRAAGVYDACPPGGLLQNCTIVPAGAPLNLTTPGIAGQTLIIRIGSAPGTCGNAPLVITVQCNCPWDIATSGGPGQDGDVNVFDLFLLLANWNTNGPGADFAPPHNLVDVADLFQLLANWGLCP